MAGAPEQPPKRGTTSLKFPSVSVVAPAEYGIAEVQAFQALRAGNATADQQRMALEWLLVACCRVNDLQYRPGADGERDTVFALGMRYPGQQVIKLLNINVAAMQRKRT